MRTVNVTVFATANKGNGFGMSSARQVVATSEQAPSRKCSILEILQNDCALFVRANMQAIVVQKKAVAYIMLQVGDNSAK